MTNTYEYTYLSWEGSKTSVVAGRLGDTSSPMGQAELDRINALAAEGWSLDQITAAPLATGWFSPGGRFGTVAVTNTVHYMAILRRAKTD